MLGDQVAPELLDLLPQFDMAKRFGIAEKIPPDRGASFTVR
jgi:hypothetical protein